MACKKWIRPFFFTLLISPLVFTASASAKDSSPKIVSDSAPIQIHGQTVEYFQAEKKTIGTGHVVIDYQGAKLEADKITVYMETKMAVAEGNVTLTQKGSVFKGSRAEYDFDKKIGYVDKMNAEIPTSRYGYADKDGVNRYPSYYARAKTVEKVSDDEFRIKDSYVTTCCGDSPFYKIEAREIDVFPEDKIVVRNALMYIMGMPILFFPYYVQPLIDFNRLPVQLAPGKSHEWGAFLLSKWRYSLVNTTDFTAKGNVLLDYREKRGFGEGADLFYHGEKQGRGAVRVYYANDQEPPENATPDRYRTQWRHQSRLTPDTTFTAEINKLSDASVMKDFFYHDEYERNVVPDNYISIIKSRPEYTFSVLERHRLDEFVTSVNRDPEVRFDTHNREFMGTPFYLRQEAQFTNLQKEYGQTPNTVGPYGEMNTTRFDLNHTLSYAGHVGDVSITPRMGVRETLYTHDIDGDTSRARTIVDPGVDVSTRFYKTYDVFINKWGLDYNQIRHIFQPTVSYNYRPEPTVPPSRLQAFDDIDALDKQNYFRFAFKNDFQTKEHGAGGMLYTREIARLEPFIDYNLLNNRLENLGYSAEVRPYTWLGFQSDATFDTHLAKVDTANFDVYFTRGPWTVSVGQRYVLDESSQTTMDIDLKIRDWEFRAYERFEFEDGTNKQFQFTISKYWDCVITDFTYSHGEQGGDTFYAALRLKAFPTTPFSLRQSYNHPRSYDNHTI